MNASRAETVSFPHVERQELMGGTLTGIFFVTAGPSAGGKRVISVHCWVLREHASVLSATMTGNGKGSSFPSIGCCVLFENCTVDASIFVVSVYERTVDALAPGADEGRGRLRYASGSCQPSCDPRISEWGNPARVMSCYPRLNI